MIQAFKRAFPQTIPVLTGYLFIGMAFGVMFQEKGYNFLGGTGEYRLLCRKRTVSGSQLFCTGHQPHPGRIYGAYGKYPPYLLWIVVVGTFFRHGKKEMVHDLFPDR